MKSVTLKEISKYKEGNTWYENEEFSGKVLVASPTFVSYSKPFMKCLVGDGETVMVLVLKAPQIIPKVEEAMKTQTELKITVESFQRRENKIFTSERSGVEIDTEDVPNVTGDIHQEIMYAPLKEIDRLFNVTANKIVSISGYLRKMNRSQLKDGSVKVTLEISDSFDNYVTVQVWRDTIMQTQYLSLRQLVTLFDLRTAGPTDSNKPQNSVALLNSTVSTYINIKQSSIEVQPITITDLLDNFRGSNWIDREVEGTLVAMSNIVESDSMRYMKCVIAEGNRGIMVLMKKNFLISTLSDVRGQKVKVIFRFFSLEDGVIHTSDKTEVQIDDEDVHEVEEQDWEPLLYAKVVPFDGLPYLKSYTRVSLEGIVNSLDAKSDQACNFFLACDSKTVRVTVWSSDFDMIATIENGMNLRIYDVKVKNDDITRKWNKGAITNVIFNRGTVIKILENAPKQVETTEVKITGRSSESLIIRSGGHKRKVSCINSELLAELSQNFPAKRRLIFENDVVTGYEK